MAETDPRIAKNERVAYRDLSSGEGGLLLHLDSGEYHGLNRMGVLIWSLIDGERSERGLALELRRRVADPPAELEGDLRAFLAALRARDLIDG